ncbi:MAG: HlyD family secretion protein [Polymorphobacter sp.]
MTETAPETAVQPAEKTTRRAGLMLFGFIVLLFVLHLFGDRLTPYTSQARIHAFVVAVAPEVGGRIEKVHVRNNQLVKKGQPLFTLGSDNFLIAAEKARADISATQRELRAQEAGITVALSNQSVAEAELVKDAQEAARFERIYREDSGAISLRRLEVARAGLVQARARVAAAAAQVEQARAARGDMGDANDRLIAARSALARANLDIARTTVVAPGDGLVTDLKTDVGQFAGAGSPMMTFIAVHDGWVTADMTENNLGRVVQGARAEVVLDAFPGTVIEGRVRSLGFGVNSGGKGQPGSLPDVQNNRDFLRQAQRFPVIIEFDRGTLASLRGVREGGQAEVIVYTGDNVVMNALGWLYIRVMGLLSYAY